MVSHFITTHEKINGKINGNTFPSSRYAQFWKDGGNLQVYTEDEYMYASTNMALEAMILY